MLLLVVVRPFSVAVTRLSKAVIALESAFDARALLMLVTLLFREVIELP